MNKAILLHTTTAEQANQLIKSAPQAILITGAAGSGKYAVAERMAAGLLGITPDKLPTYPYFTSVKKPDDKQEISIDTIRQVIDHLKLKPVIDGSSHTKRVVVVDGAHFLSHEAQNALLKVLEEPPKATTFILTAQSSGSVLPTIASRTQKMAVSPATLSETAAYYQQDYTDAKINSAWQLSGGLGGLMAALLKDDDSHPLKQAVESSKQLLKMDKYHRLLYLDGLDKTQFAQVLGTLGRILTILHHTAVKSGNSGQAKRLLDARKLVNTTLDSLSLNTSSRLTAMTFVLKMPL